MSKKQRKATFKPYNSDQLSLLAPNLDELIQDHHVVRVVSDVIDRLEIENMQFISSKNRKSKQTLGLRL